ncbi:hypothetical protein HYDPIDRAFT_120504 [Hydnomerulius pinastri MD-312]|uniref:Uncharacterized protein n=1 Tax=Hydnomerulius pinastri MD-312 TaxID=994086 RepID=A0A0C9W696_9AGAM|nr:hypothetical protein HYDPIDRAFT_120504 [Hydnomerulius pinastri MD-312]
MAEKRRTTADLLYVTAGETYGCELVQRRISRDLHHVRALASVKKTTSHLAGCESTATVSNLIHQFGSI